MGAIFPALALYIFVSMFSEGAESESRWKVFAIAFACLIVNVAAPEVVPGLLAVLVGLVVWVAQLLLAAYLRSP